MAEGYGGDVQLTRTQTIMQGADHCDFRYKLKHRKEEEISRFGAAPKSGQR